MPFSNPNFRRSTLVFTLLFLGVLITDQNIKRLFLEGLFYEGECLSFTLALNKGVAFSMFAFLGPYLKWIQTFLLLGIFIYIIWQRYLQRYPVALALILASGISNVYDRFMHGGVVDYVYWHCGFEFAIFNLADVLIDIGVVMMIYLLWREERQKGECDD